MIDTSIFIFGCCVFGIVLAATMVIAISPSKKDDTGQDVDQNR